MTHRNQKAQLALQNFCARFLDNTFQKWRSLLSLHVKFHYETHNNTENYQSNYGVLDPKCASSKNNQKFNCLEEIWQFLP